LNMNTRHRKTPAGTPRELKRGSSQLTTVAIIALVAAAAAATYFLQRQEPAKAAPEASAATNAIVEAATGGTAAPKVDFQFLKGRWARSDGNYMIEIRKVDADGQLEAGYYNPQPIHISKAEVKKDGAATKVFIELNDANYPGCKYNLTHIPNDDRLAGTYFQAAMQETYEVMFERLKE
jgi:hypothetical protein